MQMGDGAVPHGAALHRGLRSAGFDDRFRHHSSIERDWPAVMGQFPTLWANQSPPRPGKLVRRNPRELVVTPRPVRL
jgi:hypothetical protein